jgi:hypothetical protein
MLPVNRFRPPLFIDRHCPECGRPFRAAQVNQIYCSERHQQRAWRAAKMLEGTHGYINGQFARLPT